MRWENTSYLGDNPAILRDPVPMENVELIYLDPVFNSDDSRVISSVAALYERRFLKDKSKIRRSLPTSGQAPTAATAGREESAPQITRFEDAWQWGGESKAVTADFCEPKDFPGRYSRLQILTIAELLDGKKIRFAEHRVETSAKAERKTKHEQEGSF